jgi:putative oxidoreductase
MEMRRRRVEAVDIAAMLLRLVLGGTMIAHGWNHAFGGGGLAGTSRWFASIGMRLPRLQALVATVTELGAGALLIVGLATPLAAAGVVGTLAVALVTNHLRNGFFIFRPGEGYEYVLMIIVIAGALGALGAGRWSVDEALDVELSGWAGLGLSMGLGLAAAAAVLAAWWRPGPRTTD